MSQFWFKKRTSVTDFGRPANWKGWAAVILFIFIFALIMQMIGAWAFGGFAPAVTGVWLFAMLFVLFGAFLKICNQFSPPAGEA